MALYTNGFFLLFLYNKLGMVYCIYGGVTGYNFKIKFYFFRCRLACPDKQCSPCPDEMRHFIWVFTVSKVYIN